VDQSFSFGDIKRALQRSALRLLFVPLLRSHLCDDVAQKCIYSDAISGSVLIDFSWILQGFFTVITGYQDAIFKTVALAKLVWIL